MRAGNREEEAKWFSAVTGDCLEAGACRAREGRGGLGQRKLDLDVLKPNITAFPVPQKSVSSFVSGMTVPGLLCRWTWPIYPFSYLMFMGTYAIYTFKSLFGSWSRQVLERSSTLEICSLLQFLEEEMECGKKYLI